jgi:hypothetical protein
MNPRAAAALLAAGLVLGGCASDGVSLAPLAIPAGARVASAAGLVTAELSAGAAAAFFLYDPFAPNWDIDVSPLGEDRVRMDLRFKRLPSGGDGEAHEVFVRAAERLVEEGHYAGYDVLRYQEGIESSRPFARRTAMGEIRLVRSRTWPDD